MEYNVQIFWAPFDVSLTWPSGLTNREREQMQVSGFRTLVNCNQCPEIRGRIRLDAVSSSTWAGIHWGILSTYPRYGTCTCVCQDLYRISSYGDENTVLLTLRRTWNNIPLENVTLQICRSHLQHAWIRQIRSQIYPYFMHMILHASLFRSRKVSCR